jgi:phosphate/sulfate permease
MTNQPTPPGWYPDPWQQSPTRWWDGTEWSGHVGSMPVMGHGVVGVNPADRDPEKLRKVVRWTQWALFANVVFAITFPVVFHSFRELFRNAQAAQGSSGQVPVPTTFRLVQPLSALGYVVIAAWMVFTYRATTMARALGYITPREPVLSCIGWIIPIVNLWWPYQSTRALTRNQQLGGLIGWHWAAYLLGTVGCVFVSILAIFGPVWIPIIICLAITIGTAMLGRTIMLRITNELCELATQFGGIAA